MPAGIGRWMVVLCWEKEKWMEGAEAFAGAVIISSPYCRGTVRGGSPLQPRLVRAQPMVNFRGVMSVVDDP